MQLTTRIASATLLALAVASTPAAAGGRHYGYGHHHRYHHGGGIGTLGGFILGAAIIGSAAAIANDNRRDRYEQRYVPQPVYGSGYTPNDGYAAPYIESDDSQQAADPVSDCSRAAERQAQNGGGFARIVGIDRVDGFDGGADVRGRVEIDHGSGPVRRLAFTCSARFGEVMRLRVG